MSRAALILAMVVPLAVFPARAYAQACPGNTARPTWYVDADRDGWGVADGTEQSACDPPDAMGWADRSGDCNDANPAVNPAATETCNDGIDDNCDGTADGPDAVGQLTVYEDADGDGAGNEARSTSACVPPPGYVFNPDDCDDNDPTRFPGAPERCNGLDDDCDGEIDEDPDPDLAPRWFPDADGDRSGDRDAPGIPACTQPAGHVRDARDCDDGDPEIGPFAQEACVEGAPDLNCDGFSGPGDADGDGFPACEDCDDGDPSVFPGAPDTPYDGVQSDCDRIDDFDADGDGAIAEAWGGDDCVDSDPTIFPGAVDIPSDGIDQDCDDADATRAPAGGCCAGAAEANDTDAAGGAVPPAAAGLCFVVLARRRRGRAA